ncbi:unnamed protein product [Gongylonema pulchrum]|uniref:Uncharacterized protein n=1 Tax=Gongylonema pulchrum TaxID=637853 RepID=A0A183DX01_9BILA|nr:unnamed protein product [Gongylonema pulchrum]
MLYMVKHRIPRQNPPPTYPAASAKTRNRTRITGFIQQIPCKTEQHLAARIVENGFEREGPGRGDWPGLQVQFIEGWHQYHPPHVMLPDISGYNTAADLSQRSEIKIIAT